MDFEDREPEAGPSIQRKEENVGHVKREIEEDPNVGERQLEEEFLDLNKSGLTDGDAEASLMMVGFGNELLPSEMGLETGASFDEILENQQWPGLMEALPEAKVPISVNPPSTPALSLSFSPLPDPQKSITISVNVHINMAKKAASVTQEVKLERASGVQKPVKPEVKRKQTGRAEKVKQVPRLDTPGADGEKGGGQTVKRSIADRFEPQAGTSVKQVPKKTKVMKPTKMSSSGKGGVVENSSRAGVNEGPGSSRGNAGGGQFRNSKLVRSAQVGKESTGMKVLAATQNPLDDKLLKIRPPIRLGVRRAVPEEEKDEAYRLQRQKNTVAAQKCRAKKRAVEERRVEVLQTQMNTIAELRQENEDLRMTNQVLRGIIARAVLTDPPPQRRHQNLTPAPETPRQKKKKRENRWK